MLTHDDLIERLDYDPETGWLSWRGTRPGKKTNNNRAGSFRGGKSRCRKYRRININGKVYVEHRIVWFYVYGIYPSAEIDHINGDKSDNRICNLREANGSNNQCNRGKQKNNKSGYKGVHFSSTVGRWRAQIKVNRKLYWLGDFDSKEDAALAYRKGAEKLHGEFANAGAI